MCLGDVTCSDYAMCYFEISVFIKVHNFRTEHAVTIWVLPIKNRNVHFMELTSSGKSQFNFSLKGNKVFISQKRIQFLKSIFLDTEWSIIQNKEGRWSFSVISWILCSPGQTVTKFKWCIYICIIIWVDETDIYWCVWMVWRRFYL